jgi:hypothetical protein
MKKVFDLKTFIAIISIAISVTFFVISKKVKEISFKNVAITELVSGNNIKDESIKVFFDDKRVYNLYSVSCVFSNSGNLPVTKADFTNGLVIQFPDSTKILKCSMKANPKTMVILDTLISGSKFSISTDLLNPKESIELSFYVSSSSYKLLPYSDSRLIGGEIINLNINEEIKSKTEFSNRTFVKFGGLIFWLSFIYTIMYIILMFWIVYLREEVIAESALGKFFAFLFFTVGLICSLFYLYKTHF